MRLGDADPFPGARGARKHRGFSCRQDRDAVTLKENPLTISVGFLICVALFVPLFIQVGIELLCRSGK